MPLLTCWVDDDNDYSGIYIDVLVYIKLECPMFVVGMHCLCHCVNLVMEVADT